MQDAIDIGGGTTKGVYLVMGEAGNVPTRAEPRDDAVGDGSLTPTKTIGIVRVSRWRARIAGPAFVTMMSGCKPTKATRKNKRIELRVKARASN